jgi:hypothetical protein
MPLDIGSPNASTGMSKAIFEELDNQLSPPLQDAIDKAIGNAKYEAQKALEKARKSWQKLAYAIAKGVIDHILLNMEIVGIKTSGDVMTTVAGNTTPASFDNHQHTVSGTGVQLALGFAQSNDGPGHVI